MDSETKDTAYYPNLRQSLGLVILFVIGIYFSTIIRILAIISPQWLSFIFKLTPLISLIQLMACPIVILIGLKIMRKRNNDDYKLKFKRVSIPLLLILILMRVALIIAVVAIGVAIKELIPMTPKTAAIFFRRTFHPTIFTFINAVVVAPIVEEIFFRGIILEGLLKNYKPAKAIIWSAIIFGVVHISPMNVISATLSGLLIGWAYWKTNSLIPGLLLHFLNNLIASLSWFKHFKTFDYMIPILLITVIILITTTYKLVNEKEDG